MQIKITVYINEEENEYEIDSEENIEEEQEEYCNINNYNLLKLYEKLKKYRWIDY